MTAALIPDFVTSTGPRALCAEVGGDLFFPEPGASHTDVEQAKSVCRRCPLREPCLAYALDATDGHGTPIGGIWGATTVEERKALRRRAVA